MRQATMPRLGLLLMGLATTCFAVRADAQITGDVVVAKKRPHRIGAMLPPGVVGREQLMRDPDSLGYSQPVEVHVPAEATISVADGGGFSNPHLGRLKVGLSVGSVYRFKVTNIPRNLGGEVYPSVEIVGRLRPPAGMENRFPIPVQITRRDLEHALAGRLVVRAIFLEDPAKAYPEMEEKNNQRTIMALEDEDPLRLAGELGRPMAILRLGSRVPDTSGLDSSFLFGSPPITYLTSTTSSIGIPVDSVPFDGVPVESPTTPSVETFDAAPNVEESIVSPPQAGAPDQPAIDKRETTPEPSIAPELTPEADDPFLDDPLPTVDALPQP